MTYQDDRALLQAADNLVCDFMAEHSGQQPFTDAMAHFVVGLDANAVAEHNVEIAEMLALSVTTAMLERVDELVAQGVDKTDSRGGTLIAESLKAALSVVWLRAFISGVVLTRHGKPEKPRAMAPRRPSGSRGRSR